MRRELSLRVLLVASLLGAAFAGVARGQSAPQAPSNPDSAHSALSDPAFQKGDMVDAKGRKITVVNFDDAVIEGAARAPDGFVLKSRQAGAFRTILDLRREFRLQMQADGASGTIVVPPAP